MLAVVAQASPVAEPYSRLLSRAEELRSADPAGFATALGELERRRTEATPYERDRLRYLHAYQQAYSGRYDLGIQAAESLFEQTDDTGLKVRAGALVVNSRAATREFTEGLVFLDRTLALLGRVHDGDTRHHAWSAGGVM